MIDYAAILSRKYFGKEWTLDGDSYDGLTWNEKTDKPLKETLDNLWPAVSAEIAQEKASKDAARTAILERLGITEDELKLILG
jgi:hypothetical protein